MSIQLNGFEIGNDSPLTVMGGVNVLENEDLVMRVAESFKEATEKNKINWIFKGSFDKANRSSIDSFRGPGLEEGLEILQKVKEHFNVPIITDIHEPDQAVPVSKVVDIIQIPAFLCRQTDLVIAAAKTGGIIQFKKPQFLSAIEMKHVANKDWISLGIGTCILEIIALTTIATIVKYLSPEIQIITILFFRYAFSLPLLLLFGFFQRGKNSTNLPGSQSRIFPRSTKTAQTFQRHNRAIQHQDVNPTSGHFELLQSRQQQRSQQAIKQHHAVNPVKKNA